MHKFYVLPIFIFSMFIMSCASVVNDYELPSQGLDVIAPEGSTRVIFYNGNGFNPLFLDGSWRIGVKVDDVGVESMHIREYVQVFLKPGTYEIELSHVDVFTFRDTYPIEIGDSPLYIKAYNTPISTKYELETEEPEGFREDFHPANR